MMKVAEAMRAVSQLRVDSAYAWYTMRALFYRQPHEQRILRVVQTIEYRSKPLTPLDLYPEVLLCLRNGFR
jgi:hypothetical protein